MAFLFPVALLGLMLVGGTSSSAPNTCQPRADQPLMPIFHIIGNITGTGRTLTAEAINELAERHDEQLGKHGDRLDDHEKRLEEQTAAGAALGERVDGHGERLSNQDTRLGNFEETACF